MEERGEPSAGIHEGGGRWGRCPGGGVWITKSVGIVCWPPYLPFPLHGTLHCKPGNHKHMLHLGKTAPAVRVTSQSRLPDSIAVILDRPPPLPPISPPNVPPTHTHTVCPLLCWCCSPPVGTSRRSLRTRALMSASGQSWTTSRDQAMTGDTW